MFLSMSALTEGIVCPQSTKLLLAEILLAILCFQEVLLQCYCSTPLALHFLNKILFSEVIIHIIYHIREMAFNSEH